MEHFALSPWGECLSSLPLRGCDETLENQPFSEPLMYVSPIAMPALTAELRAGASAKMLVLGFFLKQKERRCKLTFRHSLAQKSMCSRALSSATLAKPQRDRLRKHPVPCCFLSLSLVPLSLQSCHLKQYSLHPLPRHWSGTCARADKVTEAQFAKPWTADSRRLG